MYYTSINEINQFRLIQIKNQITIKLKHDCNYNKTARMKNINVYEKSALMLKYIRKKPISIQTKTKN